MGRSTHDLDDESGTWTTEFRRPSARFTGRPVNLPPGAARSGVAGGVGGLGLAALLLAALPLEVAQEGLVVVGGDGASGWAGTRGTAQRGGATGAALTAFLQQAGRDVDDHCEEEDDEQELHVSRLGRAWSPPDAAVARTA